MIWRICLVFLFIASLAPAAEPYKVRPVVTVDRDNKNIPEPKVREVPFMYEFLDNSIYQQVKQVVDVPRTVRKASGNFRAINVNVMDEVPDSSWYTNRILRGKLTPEDVFRGANENPKPAFDGAITVISGKMEGVSPGFAVKDASGITWFLKFDPMDYPEMATAAEAISSRLLWAAGYNVPELWIASFRPDQLKIDSKATLNVNGGKKPMTQQHLDAILKIAPRRSDGTYRVIASRELPGKIKGGFTFYGMRKDDPNDLIPHEHRRDLRGLRVLSAWIGHDDVKSGNTASTYIEEDGRKFLRHYLWDFGSTLGSDSVWPNVNRAGNAYMLDYEVMSKALITLGAWQPKWSEDPVAIRYRSVGRFEADRFQPQRWKPNFHTIAFENMMDSDAYWATRIVAMFTDDHIKAAVRAGELSDSEAEAYVAQTLMKRRDRVKEYWFTRVTPLEEFTAGPVSNGEQEIRFRDLAMEHRLAAADRRYSYQFFHTNGKTQALSVRQSIDPRGTIIATSEVLAAIAAATANGKSDDDRVVHLDVRAGEARPVRAYFVFDGPQKGLRLVGVEHLDAS